MHKINTYLQTYIHAYSTELDIMLVTKQHSTVTGVYIYRHACTQLKTTVQLNEALIPGQRSGIVQLLSSIYTQAVWLH